MEAATTAPLTTDFFFDGRLKVMQARSGYRFSIDAVLLAAQIGPRPRDRIVDLGTGCGIIPLILAFRHPEIRLFAVEIQAELARIAKENVAANGLEGRIHVLDRDLKHLQIRDLGRPADRVICNPPYYKNGSGRINPHPQRAIARHELLATLADIVAAARRILRQGGRFTMIYPAERLPELLGEMKAARIEPKLVRAIHTDAASEAKLVLAEGIRGAQAGVTIPAPLYIYRRDGSYTEAVERMFQP